MEIIPQVYQITHRKTNIILIAEAELTLIDTGFRDSPTHIINYINSLGHSVKDISLIIITHNHLDHAGGLAELKKLTGARIAAHQADLSEREDQLPYRKTVRRLLHVPPFSIFRPLVYAKLRDIDMPLAGGEVLGPLGGLEVIHTPGHTPGSISLYAPQRRLLIVGDALNNRHREIRFPPRMVSINQAQAVDSIKKLARLDFDILCFGHGKPIIGDASARVRDLIKRHEL
jgi:glyoxylase-like metal-dependent hydrolase (beta-lactamase superfamily II)